MKNKVDSMMSAVRLICVIEYFYYLYHETEKRVA